MMRFRLNLLGAAAILLAAGSASANGGQPVSAKIAKSNEVSGVTVTAPEKASPLVNPASQFVRSHIAQSVSDQFPRFRDDICVKVIGLPAEFDAFVAKRIVEMAAEVHAPLAKAADCTPNVNVIFTPQPQAQLDDISRRRDNLLGYHFKAQFKKLTSMNRPVQAWYVTRTRDTTGNSWIEVVNPVPFNPEPKGLEGAAGERPVGRAGSRLGNDMSAEVVHSLILVDANKVADGRIGPLADYIAVLALAKWQGLERCNAIPTILNLMADGCSEEPPAVATSADVALLTALYAVDPRETGSQQRMSIASRMADALKTSEDEKAH